MTPAWRSALLGTGALWALVVVSLLLTIRRPFTRGHPTTGHAVEAGLLCLGVQSMHLIEEYLTGFPLAFPALLGLAPWPGGFFVTLNVAWIAVWAWSLLLLGRGIRAGLLALWFLALGSLVNAVGHPALAIASGGYFPGLVTSPFAGVAGFLLFRRLLRLTEATPPLA